MEHLLGKAVNAPLHPPFPELLLLNMMSYDMEHPFIQFRSAVLAVVLPSLLPIPSLPNGVGGRVGKKILMLCKCCSATGKTLVCCRQCFSTNPKHSTLWAARKQINSIPARTSRLYQERSVTVSSRSWAGICASLLVQSVVTRVDGGRIQICLPEDPRTASKHKLEGDYSWLVVLVPVKDLILNRTCPCKFCCPCKTHLPFAID